MWSGGDPTAPAAASSTDPKVLRDEYNELSNQQDAQLQVVDQRSAALTDATELLGECRQDVATAEGDEKYYQSLVRNDAEAVRQAQEQAAQYRHTQEGELRGLEPERARINADQQLGNWQNQFYWFKYFAQHTQACLEKICEDKSFGGQCLLAWLKACLRMMAVTIGNSGGPAMGLDLLTYLKIPELLQNAAPDTLARAASAASALAAKEADVCRSLADPYYDQVVEDKKAKLAQDEGEHADAKEEVRAEKGEENDAVAARDAARAEHSEAALEGRKRAQEARDKYAELMKVAGEGKTGTTATPGATGRTGGGGGRKATAAQKQTAKTRLAELSITATPSDQAAIAIAGLNASEWQKAKDRYNALNATGQGRIKANPHYFAAMGKIDDTAWATAKGELETAQPSPQQQGPTQQQIDAAKRVEQVLQVNYDPSQITPAAAADIMAAADAAGVRAAVTKHGL